MNSKNAAAETRDWFSLNRKLLFTGLWLSEPFTRGQAWVDLIGLARFKDGLIRKRGIKIEVKRGQVPYSENELATRWKWSRGKTGRFLNELENEHQIEQQKSRITTLITIINYDKYQENGQQNRQETDNRRTTNGQQKSEDAPFSDTLRAPNKGNNENNENTPDFIFMKQRYDKDLLAKAFSAIASTRKSGRVAESVLFAQLQKWERYPVGQVEAGIKIYLDKNCAVNGKDEAYLLGIIRRQNEVRPSENEASSNDISRKAWF